MLRAARLAHAELASRAFVVFSFGKTLHATGWRIGYCVAPPELTGELRKIHQFNTFGIVAPLQYKGKDAYRKDYLEFLAQYDGPIHIEYRDTRILSSGDLGIIHALERMTGKLKSGEQSDLWLRATSVVRKIHGKWLIVHDHISVPVDFETGKAVLNLNP